MTRVVDRSIDVPAFELVVASKQHRVYLGLSRDGEYAHVIAPAVELTDGDGNVIRPAGALACNCRGGTYHGHCYQLARAVAYEEGVIVEEAWGVLAAETELEKAAARG